MGQYWKFLNVDKHAEVENKHGLKLYELLSNRELECLVGYLRAPPNLAPVIADHVAIAALKTANSSGALIAFPTELLDHIITFFVTDIEALFNLAATCSYFFHLLLPTLRVRYTDLMTSWAGDRVICVGDYAEGVPANCADVPDKLVQAVKVVYDDNDPEFLEYLLDGAKHNPLYILSEHSRGISEDLYFPPRFDQSSSYKDVVKRMRQLLKVTSDDMGPKVGVLRNLDLKEYVRDDVLAASNYAYSLGEVLGLKAKWSEGHVGDWAGCRCDIDEAGPWMSQGQWKDVSDDAIDRLARIVEPRKTGRRVFGE